MASRRIGRAEVAEALETQTRLEETIDRMLTYQAGVTQKALEFIERKGLAEEFFIHLNLKEADHGRMDE